MQEDAEECLFNEKRLEMSYRKLSGRENHGNHQFHQLVLRPWLYCRKVRPISLLRKSQTLKDFLDFLTG